MAKAAKTKAKPQQEGTVVEAAMSAGSAAHLSRGLSGKAIEEAMSKAVLDAMADGVTDSAKLLKLKLAARDKLKKDFAAEQKKRAKAARAAP